MKFLHILLLVGISPIFLHSAARHEEWVQSWADCTPGPDSDDLLVVFANCRFQYPGSLVTPQILEDSKRQLRKVTECGDPLSRYYSLAKQEKWNELRALEVPRNPRIKSYRYDGMTFLQCVAPFADQHMTEKILAAGVKPNTVDGKTGMIALMYAAQHGNSAMVKVLVDYDKVGPTIIDCDACNALMHAVKNYPAGKKPFDGAQYIHDYAGVIQLLLPYSNLNQVDSWYKNSALCMAKLRNNQHAICMLIEAGAVDSGSSEQEG